MRIKAQWSEWKFRVAKGYWCDHKQYKPRIVANMTSEDAMQALEKVPTWNLGDLGRVDGWRMRAEGQWQSRTCRQCGYWQTRGR